MTGKKAKIKRDETLRFWYEIGYVRKVSEDINAPGDRADGLAAIRITVFCCLQ